MCSSVKEGCLNASESMSVMLIDLHAEDDNGMSSVENIKKNNSICLGTKSVQRFCSGKSYESNVIRLEDPKTFDERQYLLVSCCEKKSSNIYEIQCLRNEHGNGSFLVGSRVITNGDLYVSTRVDPLFFILSTIDVLNPPSQWQPLDQILAQVPSPVKSAIRQTSNDDNEIDQMRQLCHLFERSDEYGSDMILYKFSKSKTINWLKKKLNRITEKIRQNMLKTKKDALIQTNASGYSTTNASFNQSFIMFEDENDHDSCKAKCSPAHSSSNAVMNLNNIKLNTIEEEKLKEGGLQVICEYLSKKWREILIKELGISNDALLSQKERMSNECNKNNSPKQSGIVSSPSSGQKRQASWGSSHIDVESDKLLQYAMGVANPKNESETKNDKMKDTCKNAQSHGLKKLNKGNTKGMKSLSSFFGVKKQKK